MNKVALITGITGQDGSYLADFLLEKGYEVHGFVRRRSDANKRFKNIESILSKISIHWGDLSDAGSIFRAIKLSQPTEVYNLAAHAHVGESFATPEYSVDVNGTGVIRFLEAIRQIDPKVKFYQASTSELYGGKEKPPYNEYTPFHPQAPYTWGKMVGYWATKKYREAYDIFACNGILFNHEGERRGEDYLTRKVTKAVARIILGKQDVLEVGNMEAKRDWGYAPEYVKAAWLMLQKEKADDYSIGTGELHSVREWIEAAFEAVDIELKWRGKGIDEEGYEDRGTQKTLVRVNPQFFRPAEVDVMWADYSKAYKELGWKPKVKFKELVALMVKYDLLNEGKKY